jgi:hypothetical protein
MKVILLWLLSPILLLGQGGVINGTLQSAAVANSNGTQLSMAGMAAITWTVNCSVACTGGTTINFEGAQDCTTPVFVAVLAQQLGTFIVATTVVNQGTTITVWQTSGSGLQCVRARISAYSAGTITVTATAGPAPVQTPVSYVASLANFPTAVTTTGRNVVGAILAEKSSRWTVISQPASGSQATASIAAEANVRHVVDCIGFSADAGAAVVATALVVNLRDGATGAGTVIWTYTVAATVAAAAGVQDVAPFGLCGLGLTGTTNTAMTLEFTAGVTGLLEAVNISGYNVN